MTTLNQRTVQRPAPRPHSRAPALEHRPQVRGRVMRLRIVTPRKPNSARRPVVKARLTNRRRATAHIPGIGHTIRRFSEVLVKGFGPRDTPGVNYRCVRGACDLGPVLKRKSRKSIFGIGAAQKKLRRRERIKLEIYEVKHNKLDRKAKATESAESAE